jgi:DNA-binding NarL/FixJ family response regulator
MHKKTRVIIVDGYPFFRDTLSKYLKSLKRTEVIGAAGSAREAVEMTEQLVPDLVIMEIDLPEMNGISACAMIKKRYGNIKVILCGMHDADKIGKTFQGICEKYVRKDRLFDELPPIIEDLGEG